tara:strand:+ start:72677 stop:73897 length:1221 start_codon:yes stop_codon:yes gene_type:complete
MKIKFIVTLIILLSFNCYSQIIFEKGYYINNSNEKINCLIKNVDWENNPKKIQYKLSENDTQSEFYIDDVKEFGINEFVKYQRFTVQIDRSNQTSNQLSTIKNPKFEKEELFLKVLVEGKATLFSYNEVNFVKYFFTKENSDIEQLVYKSYSSTGLEIGTNELFKQQLWLDLRCKNSSQDVVKKLKYQKNDLINYFLRYNKCNGAEVINFEEKKPKRDLFNLTIRPGINSSSLSIKNQSTNNKINFDSGLAFRFGLEAEFIMPIKKNKWSLIIEPTYQYANLETKVRIYPSSDVLFNTQKVELKYNSIEIPIGIRHSIFLNNNSKLFLNTSFVLDFASRSSEVDFEFSTDLKLRTKYNLGFGVGYKSKEKYSLELRYLTSRDVLGDYVFWASNYNTLSLLVGYTLM